MSLDADAWTLLRDSPDFSPLDFSQCFTGVLSRDGSVINGRRESSGDGSAWTHDLDLTYRKVE
jgi:hypothetical protein